MTTETEANARKGVELWIPLSKLKKSPSNARRTPHGEAAIEALAASIDAKGMLQNLVVQPERDKSGKETGAYLVTAGEGRRLAQLLRVKRKQITKTEPIRCIVDATNDPLEVSLDENVTRTQMHPADQFEAFRRLSEEQGWGAEEIGARFGVSANVVRQRLRLAAVSPRLLELYREEELTLDQLMAFGVTEDHARQEQVYENLGWNDDPRTIRYMIMETHVAPDDRRVRFIGADAYIAAGGIVVRDLFSEEDGGYCEDAILLDQLVLAKLNELAAEVQQEGWKWIAVDLDFPYDHGLRRVYPQPAKLPARTQKRLDGLQAEYDRLVDENEGDEEMPDEMAERLEELEAEIERLSESERVFPSEVMAHAGVFVSLGRDGVPRIERGLVRREDEAALSAGEGRTRNAEKLPGTSSSPSEFDGEDAEETVEERPLSDALVRDLTAHRTLGLRLALGNRPDVALVAITHLLAGQTFYHSAVDLSCLEIRMTASPLGHHAEGIGDTAGAKAIEERHRAWAARVPTDAADLWDFVAALGEQEQLRLLAHCVAATLFAVQQRWDTKRRSLALTDTLAHAVSLNMAEHWEPTVESYLGRVTKAQIAEAVREAASDTEATGISGLKKSAMAEAAERLVAGSGWLPVPLRTPAAVIALSARDEAA